MENDPFIVDLPLKHGDVRVGKRLQKKNQRLLLDFPLCSSKETNGYGRIVNITSPVGLYGNFGPETRLALPLIIIGVFSHEFLLIIMLLMLITMLIIMLLSSLYIYIFALLNMAILGIPCGLSACERGVMSHFKWIHVWGIFEPFGLNMDPAKSYETMVIQQ